MLTFKQHSCNYICYKDDKYGFIDRKGNEVAAPKYDSFELLNGTDGIIRVEKDGKYGLLDKNGKEIVKPLYEDIGSPIGNLMPFYNKDFFGFFDTNGKEIIKPKYEFVMEFRDDPNYICVEKNNKYGILDKNGKEILKTIYGQIEKEGNLFKVSNGELFGYVNTSGKEIVKIKYGYEWPIYNAVDDNGWNTMDN